MWKNVGKPPRGSVGRALKVAFAAAEAAPFVKTGGLADVAGSLPRALSALGCEVVVVLPLYGSIDRTGLVATDVRFRVNVGTHSYIGEVFKGRLDEKTPVYFIYQEELFARPNPYGDQNGDYPDNDVRFIFFSLGVLELLRRLEFKADVIHANDWHLGLLPVFLKNAPKGDFLRGARSVLSLHNLAYQGLFPPESFRLTGLPESLFSADGVEMYGKLAFLKSGIMFADGLATVSPSYAKEMLSPELGFGLGDVLKTRRSRLAGILNGVDADEWNPRTDLHLPANYGAGDLTGKAKCRAELLRRAGFERDDGRPVLTVVSRLIEQKGFDMVADAAEEMMKLNMFLIVLGTGQKKYEDFFMGLMAAHPYKVFVHIGYDNPMAHLLEAGGDLFLMPSLFEPCGLNQMFSMLYGTPPIVRATGGLKDSVEDWKPSSKKGTGFVFKGRDAASLLSALKRGLKAYEDKNGWQRLVRNGMRKDFSWRVSAGLYKELYEKVAAK